VSKPQLYRVLGWDEFYEKAGELALELRPGAAPGERSMSREEAMRDFVPAIEIFVDDRGVEIGTGAIILAPKTERVVKVEPEKS
jgi:hypothetical protein